MKQGLSYFFYLLQRSFLLFCFLLPIVLMAQIRTTTTDDQFICVSKNIPLSTFPTNGTGPYTYSWSPAASLSNASISNPVATVTATTKYYVTITDATLATLTDSVTISLGNFPPDVVVEPQEDSICDGDTLDLDLFNSTTCNTLGNVCATPENTATLGTGFFQSPAPAFSPYHVNQIFIFGNEVKSNRRQIIYTKDDLVAQGMEKKSNISSIAFDVSTFFTTWTYTDFTIKIGCFSDASFPTATFKTTGFQTVFDPKQVTIVNGWNEHVFDNAYTWDGESNIIVEICFDNPNDIGFNGPFVRYTDINSPVVAYVIGGSDVCSNAATNTSNFRPNTRFKYCQVSHRTPLTFSWTPAAGLSSTTIHNPVAFPIVSTDYIVTISDTNGCSVEDTAKIVVAAEFNMNAGPDTSICGSDSIPLTTTHNAGVGTTYKWSPSSLIGSPTAQNPNGFVPGFTEFIVQVTSAGGCTKIDTLLADIAAPINLNIVTNDTTICLGDSLAIDAETDLIGCDLATTSCPSTSTGTLGNLTFSIQGAAASPFGVNGFGSNSQKKQVIVRKSDLQGMGINDATSFVDLGVNIRTLSGNTSYNNFTIKMGCTSLDRFSTTGGFTADFETGLQTVLNATTVNIAAGWNTFTFDNTFNWDGKENIIIEFCFENANALNIFTDFQTVYATNTGYRATIFRSGTNVCGDLTNAFVSFFRPDLRFNYCDAPPRTDLTYLWTPAAGLSDAAASEPKASPAISTQYILVATEPASQCSDTDTVMINVSPDFMTTTTNDTVICAPGSLPIMVSHTSPSPATFSWTPTSSVTSPTSASTSANITGSQKLYVDVESLGCVKHDSIDIGVLENLSTTVTTSDKKLCLGSSAQLEVVPFLECGASTNNDCVAPVAVRPLSGSILTNAGINISTFISAQLSTKRQFVIRSSELLAAGMQSGTLSSLSFNVTVVGFETTYEDFTIKIGCTNATQASGTFATGLTTVYTPKNYDIVFGDNEFDFDKFYNWDGESNIVVEICYNNSGFAFPFSQNSTIQYYLTPYPGTVLRNANMNTCNSTTGTTFNYRPLITFNYCNYSPTFDYSWAPTTLNNPAVANPTASPTSTTNYVVTLTEQGSNCELKDSIEIVVSDYNIDITNDTTVCNTLGFPLNVTTNATPPVSYRWLPGVVVSDSTIPNPVSVVPFQSVFNVEVTDSAGCVKFAAVNVSFFPQTPSTITPDTTICNNETLFLSSTGGTSYQWFPSTALNNDQISSPVLSNLETSTKYKVSITDANGCEKMDSVTVSVYPSPKIDFGVDSSYCDDYSVLLDANAGFDSYLWQDGSTEQTFLAAPPGEFHVSAEDRFGCVIKDTLRLELLPTPHSELLSYYRLCTGTVLTLDGGDQGADFLWSTGETTKTIDIDSAGEYWVQLFNGTCYGTDSLSVEEFEFPESDLPTEIYYCESDFPFGATVKAGGSQYSYLWSNGKRVNEVDLEEGNYTVQITNGDNCIIIDTVDVKRFCETVIYAPNSFTPNSDFINDYFSISSKGVFNFKIQIFDRWGELVYESFNPRFQWNGDKGGKALNQDVYIWKMSYDVRKRDGSYSRKSKMGDILLLR